MEGGGDVLLSVACRDRKAGCGRVLQGSSFNHPAATELSAGTEALTTIISDSVLDQTKPANVRVMA